jgi:opine dehydrogenase
MTLREFAERTAFGEDLLYGYVPISALGDQLGVETPTIDVMIELASILLGRDFWREGVTLRELGLEGMSAEEMVRYVATGSLEM